MNNTVDNFKWTDELVKEYAVKLLQDRINWAVIHDCTAAPIPISVHFDQFKQSKSIPNKQYGTLE